MNRLLKLCFFAFIVKPILFIGLGLNIRGRKNLPAKGPAIIAANHNSHMDTILLMGLYPLRYVHRLRPVAAADYFLRNPFLKWFALNIIGIIPIERRAKIKREKLFATCDQALEQGDILIIYPEGSRGQAGEMQKLKKGIYYLAKSSNNIPVTPVIINGLYKVLPKGEALFVPFNCDVIIGQFKCNNDSSDEFISELQQCFDELFSYCITVRNTK